MYAIKRIIAAVFLALSRIPFLPKSWVSRLEILRIEWSITHSVVGRTFDDHVVIGSNYEYRKCKFTRGASIEGVDFILRNSVVRGGLEVRNCGGIIQGNFIDSNVTMVMDNSGYNLAMFSPPPIANCFDYLGSSGYPLESLISETNERFKGELTN